MKLRHSLVIPLAGLAGLAMVACNGGSPTETPIAKGASVSEATAAQAPGNGDVASGAGQVTPAEQKSHGNGNGNGGNGNGNGNGHGNGGNSGHGNGNGGGGTTGTGSLQIQPGSWNLNMGQAEGTISALVRGIDVSKLDDSTVQLVVGGGDPIDPTRVQTSGGQLRAFFAMHDVIAALGTDAKPGDSVKVTLNFSVDGDAQSLDDTVRIVGHGDGGGGGDDGDDDHHEVEASLRPDEWCDAAGTVSLVLHGDVAKVDLASIKLTGDGGGSVSPTATPTLSGDSIRATFDEKAAFATLNGTDPGSRHEVKVAFTDDGTAKTLSERVRVGRCEEDNRIEADLRPDEWRNADGSIIVVLHGSTTALGKVDLGSIALVGENGTALQPTATPVLAGRTIMATFSQKDAFATLTNPTPHSRHTVTIRYTADGTSHEVTKRVRVDDDAHGH